MKFEVISLFPGYFHSVLQESLLSRAIKAGLVSVALHDLRPCGLGKHLVCDDIPYGGGGGMLLRIEPLVTCLESVSRVDKSRCILLSPQGKTLTQKKLNELREYHQLILVCGRYEGIDERFREKYIDEEISIGDYILNGGEAAAAVLIEGVARLIPGVVGNIKSLEDESFEQGLLQYPQYTRPPIFAGQKVPDILMSGDHRAISEWRKEKAKEITRIRRPDLLKVKE